jgi:hypothetical protein
MEQISFWEDTLPHVVKMFLAFFGTRMFAAVFSTAHHFSLSSARLTKSIPYHPLS